FGRRSRTENLDSVLTPQRLIGPPVQRIFQISFACDRTNRTAHKPEQCSRERRAENPLECSGAKRGLTDSQLWTLSSQLIFTAKLYSSIRNTTASWAVASARKNTCPPTSLQSI